MLIVGISPGTVNAFDFNLNPFLGKELRKGTEDGLLGQNAVGEDREDFS